MGDIKNLELTLKSIRNQTVLPYEHILVVSGVKNISAFCQRVKSEELKMVINQDKSIYDAMNIGLKLAKGNAILFMNAGDTFVDNYSLQSIEEIWCPGKCFCFRSIQVYGSDRYIRPSLKKLSLLRKIPPHQSFVAPLPEAKSYPFLHTKYTIKADHWWMKILMSAYKTEINPRPISIFHLGGISNMPTPKTLILRFKEEGIISFAKESCRYMLRLIFGNQNYYRILALSKCDYIPRITSKDIDVNV